MRRRDFLLATGASLLPVRARAQTPMNVLVLIADDMRADLMGVAGNKLVRTPNLDRLARAGLYFPDAFVTTSVCPTSRASIMLGEYASRHKNIDFGTPLAANQWETSYHGRLKAQGYRTGYIGKWGLGGPLPSGFDVFDGFAGPGKYIEAGRKHLTAHLADRALEFITDQRDPYCLTVGFWAPHAEPGPDPAPAEERFRALYRDADLTPARTFSGTYNDDLPDSLKEAHSASLFADQLATPERYRAFLAGYLGLITGMDDAIGRILSAVDLDNTLVIFLSDNGFFLGEHGLPGKWLAFEESIRIPLIVKAPGVTGVSNELALNIDVAPTIYGALGLRHRRDGHDLLRNRRDHFFYEYALATFGAAGIRTRDKKFVIMPEHEFEMAFDLKADPFEQNNLAQENPDWVALLREKVVARYGDTLLAD
ncbi:MAG: sulfatase-like hydrolase/transferase [Rhodospirillaceae bacterium]|jgi:arylsulfatase A-like enzyme|nr:sulfatase-like hydrolase/transferase [Rhodospirillaceae bacterium]MBT5770160.1 sulfatase-like hydrolase/transferase [Rhodospirillaceae bacterium]MBT7364236.1 sulfatase-like hydrolase/transferase [Rhodospirillaceae bacterium]